MFKVFPNELENSPAITFFPRFSALCEIGVSPFSGNFEIEYIPDRSLLEFESFEDYLFEISTESFTIESLGDMIFSCLLGELEPQFLRVKIFAETIKHAPATVEFVYTGD